MPTKSVLREVDHGKSKKSNSERMFIFDARWRLRFVAFFLNYSSHSASVGTT
jgi:hypothetical protein